MVSIREVMEWSARPAPFERAGQPIWTDPYVARQLLAAHLDPDTEAASRKPEDIDRCVQWVLDTVGLEAGARVLDLGCGPGLYAERLARRGMLVTGVDFNGVSIEYARDHAAREHLDIEYCLQDYRALRVPGPFNAALLVYGDYCVLSSNERRALLGNIKSALAPHGRLVLDVTTRACRAKHGLRNRWYAKNKGFWSDRSHIVLEQGFDYPDQAIYLDQYIVISEGGSFRVFRNWFQDFTAESIRAEIEEGGFRVTGIYGDLMGHPLTEDSEWIGVVAETTSPA